MTDLEPFVPLAKDLIDLCSRRSLKIVTAESCTGGLIAATLTEIAGSSAVVDRGLVTYSNQAKIDLLDVPADLLATRGAVSEAVVMAMAAGALKHAPADLAVAVTGIAGPGGGTPDKPVGLVHFAVMRRGGAPRHAVHVFEDLGRASIRLASVRVALTMLKEVAAP
jgi:nicotinamide-nucleotide amidase